MVRRMGYEISLGSFLMVLMGFFFSVTAQEVSAEAEDDNKDSKTLQTVITPTRSIGPVIDSDRTTIRVGRDAVEESQPNDLLDALSSQGAVHAQRTNLGAAAPIVRGLVGPQNLILIEGLRFNNSTFRTGPNQYLALIDPFGLESMELQLGPGSVLYGSDALGSVIQALPLKHQWSQGVRGRTGTSFNTADRGLSNVTDIFASDETISVWAGARLRAHGTLRVGGGDVVPLSDFTQRDWRASAAVKVGESWVLTGTYLAGQIEDAGRVDQLGKGDVRVYDNLDHFVYLDARYAGGKMLKNVRLATVYHQTGEEVQRYGCRKGEDGLVLSAALCADLESSQIAESRRYVDQVDTFGFLGETNWFFFEDRMSVLVGFDGYLDLVSSSLSVSNKGGEGPFEQEERGNFSDGSQYFQTGIFTYAEGELYVKEGMGALTASLGARGTYAGAFAPDVPGLGDVAYDDFGFVFTGGIRQTFLNQYALFGNFSQGFRLPNLQEATVLGDVGSVYEVPNDSLRSERSHTLEFGGRILRPTSRLSVSYFHSWVTDLIIRENAIYQGNSVVEGKDVFTRTNAGKATFYGVQGRFTTDDIIGFSLEGNVSWTVGNFLNAEGDKESARRVPPLFGRTTVHYSSKDSPLRVSVYLDWADEKKGLSPKDKKDIRICGDPNRPGSLLSDCETFDGYLVPGVMVQWKPRDTVSVVCEIRNVLDTHYRTFGSGVDAPGISAHVGAVVHY